MGNVALIDFNEVVGHGAYLIGVQLSFRNLAKMGERLQSCRLHIFGNDEVHDTFEVVFPSECLQGHLVPPNRVGFCPACRALLPTQSLLSNLISIRVFLLHICKRAVMTPIVCHDMGIAGCIEVRNMAKQT